MFFDRSIPEHYGALPVLGWVWALSLAAVYLAVVLMDFGVIFVLMKHEEFQLKPVNKRRWYLTFVVNDLLLIPLFLLRVTQTMNHYQHPVGPYTSIYFHLMVLAFWCWFSINMERDMVKKKVFTIGQERSRSKLYHTVIFGPMGYLMSMGFIFALANERRWDVLASEVVLAALWFLVVNVFDGMWLKMHGREGMTPVNAHPEADRWFGRVVRWRDD